MNHLSGLDLLFFVRIHRDRMANGKSSFSEKKYLRLTSSLLMTAFGSITGDHVKQLYFLLSQKDSMVPATLRWLQYDTFNKKQELFRTFISKDATYYSLRPEGFRTMVADLSTLFDELENGYSFDKYVSTEDLETEWGKYTYADYNALPHTCPIITQAIYLIFSIPLRDQDLLRLFSEYNLTARYKRQEQKKRKGDLCADLFMANLSQIVPRIGIEVDLNTERVVSGISSLAKKIVAYEAAFSAESRTDLLFLMENSQNSELETTIPKPGEDPYYDLIGSMLHNESCSSAELGTLFHMVTLGYEHIKTQPDQVVRIRDIVRMLNASWIEDMHSVKNAYWFRFLQVISKHIDLYGHFYEEELPEADCGLLEVSQLIPLIQSLNEKYGEKKIRLATDRSGQYLQRKRESIYMALSKEVCRTNIRMGQFGVTAGMSLFVANHHYAWNQFPCYYPLTYYKERILMLCKRISSTETVLFYDTPCTINSNDATDPYPVLSFPHSVRTDKGSIVIENLSDDLGAMVRIQKYLRLPYGSCKGVIVVALLRSEILADGRAFDAEVFIPPAGIAYQSMMIWDMKNLDLPISDVIDPKFYDSRMAHKVDERQRLA